MNQEIVLTPPPEDEAKRQTRTPKGDHPTYGRLDLDIYSPADIATRLGVNKNTILEECQAGNLKAKKFGGPIGYRILHADLIAWLNTR